MNKARKLRIAEKVSMLLGLFNTVEDHLFISSLIVYNLKDIEEKHKQFLREHIHPALWGESLKELK